MWGLTEGICRFFFSGKGLRAEDRTVVVFLVTPTAAILHILIKCNSGSAGIHYVGRIDSFTFWNLHQERVQEGTIKCAKGCMKGVDQLLRLWRNRMGGAGGGGGAFSSGKRSQPPVRGELTSQGPGCAHWQDKGPKQRQRVPFQNGVSSSGTKCVLVFPPVQSSAFVRPPCSPPVPSPSHCEPSKSK